MRVFLLGAICAALVLSPLTFLPSAIARHAPSQHMVGIFFDDPVSFASPTRIMNKSKSVCGGLLSCKPVGGVAGSSDALAFNNTTNPLGQAFSFSSDLEATVWLHSTQNKSVPVSPVRCVPGLPGLPDPNDLPGVPPEVPDLSVPDLPDDETCVPDPVCVPDVACQEIPGQPDLSDVPDLPVFLTGLTVEVTTDSGAAIANLTSVARIPFGQGGQSVPVPFHRPDDGSLLGPPEIPNKPTPFRVTGTGTNASIPANAKLGLRVTVFAIVGAHQNPPSTTPPIDQPVNPIDIYIDYGSSQTPSGVVFGIDRSAGSSRLGNDALRLSLDNQTLLPDFPEGADGSRLIEGSPIAGDFGSAVVWGNASAPDTMRFVSDAVLNLTLSLPGSTAAGVTLGVTANLTLGGRTWAIGTSHYQYLDYRPSLGGGERFRLSLPLNTSGMSVTEGEQIQLGLKFSLLSAGVQGTDPVLNKIFVHYGNATAPSGLLAAVESSRGGGGTGSSGSSSGSSSDSATGTGNNPSNNSPSSPNLSPPSGSQDTGNGVGSPQGSGHSKNISSAGKIPNVPFVLAAVAIALGLLGARRRFGNA